MKVLSFLFFLSAAVAFPTGEERQVVLGAHTTDIVDALVHDPGTSINVGKDYKDAIEGQMDSLDVPGNLQGSLFTHPSFSDYALRITEPTLCDGSVQQHSGYLDITNGKHLFFWFFESRNDPSNDPLILWLNGGPGCSSLIGLLFELGPCRIADEGNNTTMNLHSWNQRANIIFLEQPVGVGYSYSSDGSKVDTSPVAAEDVYAFLQLFLARFPKFAHAPFHLAAESYGGIYAPNIASVIHRENRKLPISAPRGGARRINLASVILANGLTDPYVQFGTFPDYACDSMYAVYDDPDGQRCQELRRKTATCQRLIQTCYDFDSRFTCAPATLYCFGEVYGQIKELGLNMYDIRGECDLKGGDLCYREEAWIDTWMNKPGVKDALGVDPARTYTTCNTDVSNAFLASGDSMRKSMDLLPELINDGIRLLVYAGDMDITCNFIVQCPECGLSG